MTAGARFVVPWTMLAALFLGASATAQTVTTHPVQWIVDNAPGAPVPGAGAAVIREWDGLSVVIQTRHLQAGPATVWLFFFTCDAAGVCSTTPTNGRPMFGTADVVEPNGKGNFAVGVPLNSPFLTDPASDEVHAVIVDGKPPGAMWQRLTTPAGGTLRQVVIARAP